MTYNGLESCILNGHSCESESRTSRGDGCPIDSLDEDDSSFSSSKDGFGSFSSKWLSMKRDDQEVDEWAVPDCHQHFCVKEKPAYSIQFSDVETMKEKFAKLLLGEDVTGGRNGHSTALALSNAITNLAGVKDICLPCLTLLCFLCALGFTSIVLLEENPVYQKIELY